MKSMEVGFSNAKSYWDGYLDGGISQVSFYHEGFNIDKKKQQMYSKQAFVLDRKDQQLDSISVCEWLFAAYQLLIMRYTSQDTFVLGKWEQGNQLLPYRVTNIHTLTVKELLDKVSNECEQHNKNRDSFSDFKAIADDISVFYMYQLNDERLMIENYYHSQLCLEVINRKQYIDIIFHYQDSVFQKEDIVRMAQHYKNIAISIICNPDSRTNEVKMLAIEEEKYLLQACNQTAYTHAKEKNIVQQFEQQVSATPNQIALVYNDTVLTYDTLNKRANTVAHLLLEKGLEDEEVVAVVAERSIEMVIGVLGILKAGGAYLPIDRKHPEKRIKYMTSNSQVRFMLCDHEPLEWMDECQYSMNLKNLTDETDQNPVLTSTIQANHLAYVVYTSGSTGLPKGVMIEQQSLMNVVAWMKRQYSITENDKSGQYINFSFDPWALEVFPYLLSGAAVYIIPEEIRMDIYALNQFYEHHAITVSALPTPVCEQFMELDNQSLRILITGGDKLRKYVKRHYRLINHYGPTEHTIVATETEIVDKNIHIGRPIANTEILILNEYNQVQPIGVPGELCISGVGISRGYINNSRLTAEHFVQHPFKSQCKMYKTGDLAVWLPNGNIQFIGRKDKQIKIRGNRVEIDEIINGLLQLPEITDALVTVKEYSHAGKSLIAYLIAKPSCSMQQIKQKLSNKLPSYMVPEHLIILDKFPLTVNGKVDYKSLPVPTVTHSNCIVPPETNLEKQLHKIWIDVLQMKEISILDSFFELGGHSLLAMILLSRIHSQLNHSLSLAELFENPTIQLIAKVLHPIEQRNTMPLEKVASSVHYPIAAAQKRMFSMAAYDNHTTYNILNILYLYGELDLTKLEESFCQLINRHDSLRTSFYTLDGCIVQRIHDSVDFHIERMKDGTSLEEMSETIMPFNLNEAPLIRVKVSKVNNQKYLCLIDTHHIISDGVSINLLIKELQACYKNEALQPLAFQYKDYASWQEKLRETKDYENDKQYWLNKFKKDIPTAELPLDNPRKAVRSFQGDSVQTTIDVSFVHKLKEYCQQHGVTLYMYLMSVYQIWLAKYAGQEDVVVGTVTAGRNHAEMHDVIGMFVNTLAIKGNPKNEKRFSTFLQETKQCLIADFEHQLFQFDDLVDELTVTKEASRNPIFDTMFVMENMDMCQFHTENVTGYVETIPSKQSKFDLTFILKESEKGLQINLEYATELFQKRTVERFLMHYIQLIQYIVEHEEDTIGSLDMMSKAEHAQILDAFNDTVTPYQKDCTLHALFEQQVRQTPNRVAVAYNKQTLTYQELNNQANQLAYYLIEQGIQQNHLVGVILNKSIDMIVSMIAILKAGAAYVPIDPTYPDERIVSMLQDAQPTICITSLEMEERLNRLSYQSNLDLSLVHTEKRYLWKTQCTENPKINMSSDALAYVMYTSGSTGQPKGILTRHYNVNRLVNHTNYFHATKEDAFLQIANVAFDGSTFDIYGSLLRGAKLVLVNRETISDLDQLENVINTANISIMFVPTGLFHTIAEVKPQCFKNVHTVLVGGDKLSPLHVEKVLEVTDTKIINGYGPTESTVFATAIEVNEYVRNNRDIPIGKPISNTEIYILDRESNLCPVGITGEIYIGGDGLAAGYLNRFDLTEASFRYHPKLKKRLYKTGDYGNWLEDGSVAYGGRIDHQVKVKGFRVEIAEVEQCLLAEKHINEVAIIVDKVSNLEKQLIAYIVADKSIETNKLRQYVAKKLPSYMIPSTFIQIDSMPLNANGKVDKVALLSKVDISSSVSKVTNQVSNEMESILVDVYQKVLKVNTVDLDELFFYMGGDSIKAIQIASKLHQLGYTLDAKHLLANASIRQLAEHVRKMQKEEDTEYTEGFLEYSPIQRWFNEKQMSYPNHFNQSYMLHEKEGYDVTSLSQTFTAIMNHHDVLRMVIKDGEPYIQRKLENPFEISVYDYHMQDDIEKQITSTCNDIQRSINLDSGPLVKVALFQTLKGDYLFIAIHHFVVDGISWRIILEDVESLYKQILQGEQITLPDKTVSFHSWLTLLKEYANSPAIEEERKYWKDVVDITLPVLHPNVGQTSNTLKDMFKVSMSMTKEQTNALSHQVNRAYRTNLNDLLVTALALAINDTFSIHTVGIGMEGHGREQIGKDVNIGRTVGWFTTIYPIVLQLETQPTLSHSIKKVKETIRKVPNKGIGYHLLKYFRSNNEAQKLSSMPLDIGFNYMGEFLVDNMEDYQQLLDWKGQEVGNDFTFDYVINVEGILINHQLTVDIYYNKHLFSEAKMQSMQLSFQQHLLSIITHCLSIEGTEWTPSDFTDSEIDEETLDEVFNLMENM